jgi:hypothetical protein
VGKRIGEGKVGADHETVIFGILAADESLEAVAGIFFKLEIEGLGHKIELVQERTPFADQVGVAHAGQQVADAFFAEFLIKKFIHQMTEIVRQAIGAGGAADIAVILDLGHAVAQHAVDDGQHGKTVPIAGHELGKTFHDPEGRLVKIEHAAGTSLVQNGVFERVTQFMGDQARKIVAAAVAVDHHPVVVRFGKPLETAGGDQAGIEIGLFDVGLLVVIDQRCFFLDGDIQKSRDLVIGALGLASQAFQQFPVRGVMENAEVLGIHVFPGKGLAHDLIFPVKIRILGKAGKGA